MSWPLRILQIPGFRGTGYSNSLVQDSNGTGGQIQPQDTPTTWPEALLRPLDFFTNATCFRIRFANLDELCVPSVCVYTCIWGPRALSPVADVGQALIYIYTHICMCLCVFLEEYIHTYIYIYRGASPVLPGFMIVVDI